MLYRSIKPLVVDAVQVQERTEVKTESGVIHAEKGDWLIRDPQGNLYRCDDMTFKFTYDTLADWTPVQDLAEGRPCGC